MFTRTNLRATGVRWGLGLLTAAALLLAPVTPPAAVQAADAPSDTPRVGASASAMWHTFMGAAGGDSAEDIRLDPAGNIYVVGIASGTFGTPLNPFAGEHDAVVARLSNAGSLQWHRFFGNASVDWGNGLYVDRGGSVYVAGTSSSTWGAPVVGYSGDYDPFVAKVTQARLFGAYVCRD